MERAQINELFDRLPKVKLITMLSRRDDRPSLPFNQNQSALGASEVDQEGEENQGTFQGGDDG